MESSCIGALSRESLTKGEILEVVHERVLGSFLYHSSYEEFCVCLFRRAMHMLFFQSEKKNDRSYDEQKAIVLIDKVLPFVMFAICRRTHSTL